MNSLLLFEENILNEIVSCRQIQRVRVHVSVYA